MQSQLIRITKMFRGESDELRIAAALADVWNLLTDEERQLVVGSIQMVHYSKNETIYNEGDKPVCLYCLANGKIKICKMGVSGRQQIIRMVKPKDFFGYSASFAGVNYIANATVMEDSDVFHIPLYVARKVVTNNLPVSVFFLQRLAAHLGESMDSTVSLTQKHIRGRLAEALIRLRDSFGLLDDGQTLAITASREELANLSNMTTSNAIRTLSAFVQEGLVETDGRKIRLLDEDQLQKISDNG